MIHTHSYTWLEGDLPDEWVRRIRKTCHQWKIASSLVRRKTIESANKRWTYKLTFESPTEKGLAFAKHVFETSTKLLKTSDADMIATMEDAFAKGDPPFEHLEN